MDGKVTFVAPDGDRFRKVLFQRVDAYFKENNLSKHANAFMVLKTIVFFSMFYGSWALIMFAQPPVAIMWLLWAVTGFSVAMIGFNVAHDASHGGFTGNKRLNRLLAHSFSLVGVHAYNWNITHNIIHHTYTNIPYADGDLHPASFLRYFDIQENKKWYHRYQHIYAPFLYSLVSLVWVFVKDYQHISRPIHVRYKKPKVPVAEYFILAGVKLLHYGMFLVFPIVWLPNPWWHIVVGFLIMHLVAGFILAIVFAVAHTVDNVEVIEADAEGKVNDSWAGVQLRTSANFSMGSRFFDWTVGGLNYQIEHHLFPKICHVHYRKIAPIVEETAKEFGYPYHVFGTFSEGIKAHFQYLRHYGAVDTANEPVTA